MALALTLALQILALALVVPGLGLGLGLEHFGVGLGLGLNHEGLVNITAKHFPILSGITVITPACETDEKPFELVSIDDPLLD